MKNRVESLRKEKGWSREKLAGEAGVSFFTVISLEKQEGANGQTQLRIAQALGKPVEEVFFLEPSVS